MAAPKEVPELIQDEKDKSLYKANKEDILHPFYARIPKDKPLTVGAKLKVCGEIPRYADTFSINLVRNKDSPQTFPQSGCVLHFNPRLKKKIVVRNYTEDGKWHHKDERNSDTFPFAQGTDFEVDISMRKLGYKIFVDGEEFCDFTRTGTQFTSAKYIYIAGDVKISSVELRYPPDSLETPPPYSETQ